MADAVNHPAHYNSRGMEAIELVEMLPFCEGNACKYLWRAGLKGPALEDFQKALWYAKRALQSERALKTHRSRPFNWILQRALDEFADDQIRQAIKCIGLGKTAIAIEYIEELIRRASPVPQTASQTEACTQASAA